MLTASVSAPAFRNLRMPHSSDCPTTTFRSDWRLLAGWGLLLAACLWFDRGRTMSGPTVLLTAHGIAQDVGG